MQSNRKETVLALLLLLVSGPALAQECSGFWENSITSGGTNGAVAVFAIDLDGDGDTDIISASYNDDMIAWYEADDSNPPNFTQRVITTAADGVTSVFAIDVDLDDDIDILAASPYADEIALYENIGSDPPGFFKTQITNSANHAVAVYAADVDGDGDIDVLSASFADNKIAWYENPEIENTTLNPDGGSARYVKHVITSNASRASSVFAVDMDSDGDTDVLSASATDDKIAWYEAALDTDTDGVVFLGFTEHLISDEAVGAKSVYAADLDNDGDPDVISAANGGNKIAWYESDIDTSGSAPLAFTEHVVSATVMGANSVHAADIDSDGDIDLLSASGGDDTIAWYRNDGASPPSFETIPVSVETESADAVFAADVDNDGRMDILSASSVPGSISRNDKIAWFENDGSDPPDWTERVITETAEGSNWLHQADIDSDGDLDLVSATTNGKVSWYEIEEGADPLFTQHLIADDLPGASAVFAADIDSDGDQDVIASSSERDRILWYANNDTAPGTFEAARVVTTNTLSVQSVFVADVNMDGHPDVLSASSGDDKIAWHENDGESPPGFTEHVISSSDAELSPYATDGARSVFATDLDGDAYIDVLAASSGDDKITWFEWAPEVVPPNIPWVRTIIASYDSSEAVYSARGASSVSAADIDGDGDGDVLVAASGENTIAWYEQQPEDGGPGVSFVRHVIDGLASIAVFVSAADIDSDGDLDILSASTGNDQIAWYENDIDTDDGQDLIFTKHVVDSSGVNPRSVVVHDVNEDGRVDLFAGQRFKVSWYEQIGELCTGFDANGDDIIDGNELAWLGRAFGESSIDPPAEWWYVIDFNMDGFVDGDDLAILADPGVWGQSTGECSFTCK
jgi:hypothetical protein